MEKPQNYPGQLKAHEVRKCFLNILGPFETPSAPLKLRITDQNLLEGDVVCQRIEYDVDMGEQVSAFHLFRKGISPDTPGILSIHAHDGEEGFLKGKAYNSCPDLQDPSQYSYHNVWS